MAADQLFRSPWFWILVIGIVLLIIGLFTTIDSANKTVWTWLGIILIVLGILWWMRDSTNSTTLVV